MTCIIALKHMDEKGTVTIAGDSAGVSGLNMVQRKDPKVFKKNGFGFGFTTSFRMGQILMHNFDVPENNTIVDPYEYMVKVFVPDLQKLFAEYGFDKTKEDGEKKGGCFIIGYKGRIFKVESDFQVAEAVHNFDAIGCGKCYALGSLHTTEACTTDVVEITTDQRITMAMRAADTFSGGVAPPFNIIQVTKAEVT